VFFLTFWEGLGPFLFSQVFTVLFVLTAIKAIKIWRRNKEFSLHHKVILSMAGVMFLFAYIEVYCSLYRVISPTDVYFVLFRP